MRINLWSGAGAGKSTTASGCYYRLKCNHHNVELVHEYIKSWAYENKKPKSFDQLYIFGKQVHAEDHLLQHGVEHIVTDSPILMQVFYARRYNFPCWEQLLAIGKKFESLHPSINIFLDRTGLPYKAAGRYETASQAQEVDREMLSFMSEFVGEYKTLPSRDLDAIVKHIETAFGVKTLDTMFSRMWRKFFA